MAMLTAISIAKAVTIWKNPPCHDTNAINNDTSKTF
jgi:hypothetical protein